MTTPIRAGQIYRAIRPSAADPSGRRITIKTLTGSLNTIGLHSYGKVYIVTVTDDGREIRRRRIKTGQLHATDTTHAGAKRTTGYVLVRDAEEQS